MPLTPDWATFFSAELAALATLTGLVAVAISINLPRILSHPHLPTRAGESLIGPVGAIMATSLVLIPDQPPMLLGAEVIVIGLVMVLAPIVFQARAWRVRKDAWERYMRAVSTTGFSLAFVSGGALLVEGARSSRYLDRRGRRSWNHRGRLECVGVAGRDSALRLLRPATSLHGRGAQTRLWAALSLDKVL